MNITFTKIKLHNFFSFEDVELSLNDLGYTLVTGRNYCKLDNAYSNGSGKSAIFNGICYALTGETSQGISDSLGNIFTDPSDCWVELSLRINNDDFIIKRIKEPKSDLILYVNGENKSGKGVRESSKLLADYIPDLTPVLINSVIILGQGLPNRFTNNKPSHRKEILEKLTKSDFMIQDLKDKLEFRQNFLKSSLREKEDSLLANNSKLKVYSDQLESLQEELSEYDKYNNSETNLEMRIESLSEYLNSINQSINDFDKNISSLNKEISLLNDNHLSVLEEKNKEKTSISEEFDSEITSENNNKIEISSELKSLEKEYKKLASISDICPTCGQKIPEVKKPDLVPVKTKIDYFKTQEISTESKIKQLKADRQLRFKENDEKYEKLLKSNQELINSKKESLSDLQSQKSRVTTEKENLTQDLFRLNNLKINYNKLLSNVRKNNENIDKLNKKNKKIDKEIVNLNAHLDLIQQLITLTKREFRGVLLINIITYINSRVKKYSLEVFGTEELEFKLNDNYIDITYCNKPYENLSGGERQKIDVIVQLALRDVLSEQLGIHSNLLVCDEIFDNLDSQGCNKILNLISGLTDIDSVFIISHHSQDLEISQDNELLVEKGEDGVSTIRFV